MRVFSIPVATAGALLAAPTAAASFVDTLTPIGWGAVATAVVAAIFAIRSGLSARAAFIDKIELTERLAATERTVAALQVTRGELERAVVQKQAAIDEIDAQRAQSQDMLATLRQQIGRVARIDAQTGIANHQHFIETLGEEIKRGVRQKKPVAVLVGEIDFFDEYIDVSGNERGEHALLAVASAVSDTFRRAGDLVARIGKARFAVVLPEADESTAQRFAEKLRRRIYDLCLPYPGSEAADRITMSVGLVSAAPTRLHDRKELIALAEHALIHAQSNGRNQVARSANAA